MKTLAEISSSLRKLTGLTSGASPTPVLVNRTGRCYNRVGSVWFQFYNFIYFVEFKVKIVEWECRTLSFFQFLMFNGIVVVALN